MAPILMIEDDAANIKLALPLPAHADPFDFQGLR
jgi:hypothetical protein